MRNSFYFYQNTEYEMLIASHITMWESALLCVDNTKAGNNTTLPGTSTQINNSQVELNQKIGTLLTFTLKTIFMVSLIFNIHIRKYK